jgi:hypothetical protein
MQTVEKSNETITTEAGTVTKKAGVTIAVEMDMDDSAVSTCLNQLQTRNTLTLAQKKVMVDTAGTTQATTITTMM